MFHAIKAMRMQIVKKGVEDEESEEVERCIKGLANARSEEIYVQYHTKLQGRASTAFFTYFNNNWHAIKEKWVKFEVEKYVILGNRTINRVESHHNKLKKLLGGKLVLHEDAFDLHDGSRVEHHAPIASESVSRESRQCPSRNRST